MSSSHLLIIADQGALAWVLGNQRMAFPARRARVAGTLQVGDELLLYTTTGCFHNPTRDPGRVIGKARLATAAQPLAEPVHLAGREFSIGCELVVERLAPFRKGLEFAPLIPELSTFPNKNVWTARMRRPLVTLTRADAALVGRRLAPLTVPPEAVVGDYLAAAAPS